MNVVRPKLTDRGRKYLFTCEFSCPILVLDQEADGVEFDITPTGEISNITVTGSAVNQPFYPDNPTLPEPVREAMTTAREMVAEHQEKP